MLTYLSLGHGGRIGNQMFAVAAVLGLARKTGHTYAFPYWMNYEHKEAFGSQEDIDIQSWFKNPLPLLQSKKGFENEYIEFNADPDHYSLSRSQYTNMNITQQWSGHLQSEKWFANCKDLVRSYFQFDEQKISDLLSIETFPWLYTLYTEVCGIHVRIGDYAKEDSWQPVLGNHYYHYAMLRFPEDTTFVVFSDEPEKAKEMFKDFDRHMIFISDNHSMIDLYLMTQCKNFIIGNSTYSWWGAWLIEHPGKKIVAPSQWWTERAAAQWGYSTKNLYPENWIVI